MANQEMTITGNIGGIEYKEIEKGVNKFLLAEISVAADETRRNKDTQQFETVPGSQNWYQVTVWGDAGRPESLDGIRKLGKGCRVKVSGAFSAEPWIDNDGNPQAGLRINTNPSQILLMLNRVEQIVMKPKSSNTSEDSSDATSPQNESY